MSEPGLDEAPHVSVVIATRDRKDTLVAALDSVLTQTYRDLEVIVVDDGSVDGTSEVLSRYAARDPRVTPIRNRAPRGAPAARNAGIAAARGDYLALLDDDAVWLPEKLTAQLAALAGTTRATVAYCAFEYVRSDGDRVVIGSAAAVDDDAHRAVSRRAFVDTSCLLAHTSAIRAIDGFDESLPRLQDWDLTIRLAKKNRFSYVPLVLVRTYQTPGSISSRPDFLTIAAQRILDKEVASRAPLAHIKLLRRALAHALMIGGSPAAGRRMLLEGLRHAPDLYTAIQMVVALLGRSVYGRINRLRDKISGGGLR